MRSNFAFGARVKRIIVKDARFSLKFLVKRASRRPFIRRRYRILLYTPDADLTFRRDCRRIPL